MAAMKGYKIPFSWSGHILLSWCDKYGLVMENHWNKYHWNKAYFSNKDDINVL